MREKPYAGKTLMAILAHPDDESFGMGGTLAKYAREGARVVLVCATRGEEGKTGAPPLCTREELGAVREQELRRAAAVLGIQQIYFLDYRDKGLTAIQEEEAVSRLVELIRIEQPQVMVTFGPDGISGHADHIAVSRWATRAFAEARQSLSQGSSSPPDRLYYIVLEKSLAQALGFWGAGVPEEEITATIDVGPYYDLKLQAVQCHQTQILSIRKLGFLAEGTDPRVQELRCREHFIRVFPPLHREKETELFA